MTTTKETHPSEETLIALALGENGTDAAAHVEGCAQCGAFVREMRELRASVAGIDEEDPPRSLQQNVMRAVRMRGIAGLARGVLQGAGMFLLSMATIMFVVFVYLMVTLLM